MAATPAEAGPASAEKAALSKAWGLCASLIEAAEQALELPPHLLQAISKVESGRWNKATGANLAWPWTVTAEGKGRFLPDKRSAIAEVEALRARGIKNIDVGCTQVNLMYHGEAFDDLSQALDPVHNVAYAAVFLSQLRKNSRSWTKAVGRYHSHTPKFSGPYRKKVFRAWRQEKKAAYKREAESRESETRRTQAAEAPPPKPVARPQPTDASSPKRGETEAAPAAGAGKVQVAAATPPKRPPAQAEPAARGAIAAPPTSLADTVKAAVETARPGAVTLADLFKKP